MSTFRQAKYSGVSATGRLRHESTLEDIREMCGLPCHARSHSHRQIADGRGDRPAQFGKEANHAAPGTNGACHQTRNHHPLIPSSRKRQGGDLAPLQISSGMTPATGCGIQSGGVTNDQLERYVTLFVLFICTIIFTIQTVIPFVTHIITRGGH